MFSTPSGEISSMELEIFRSPDKGQKGAGALSVRTVETVCDHRLLQVGLCKLVKYFCVI